MKTIIKNGDRHQNNYARSLIEASLDPLVTISAEGKITDVNEASVNVTGIPREKLIGTDFSDYFTDSKKAQEGYLQVFEKGFVADYPLTIKHKNKKLTDVLYNASVYKDDKGNVLGVFAAARDVTAQKQSSQYAQSLLEASLDLLVTISAEGKITDVNEASVNVTGIPREKLIGTDFSDYFTDSKKAQEGYLQVFEKGFVADYPLTIKHKNKKLTDVLYNASVYKDDKGNVLGVFAAARDVTAQKQSSQYARSLIEASLDPLVTISAEGKITDVNEASVNVTGIPREKLIGTDFSDYFTDSKKAQEGYLQVFEKGFVADYPLTIKHKNGKLTDVLYNASVYKDDKGNVLGVFAAARDVTEQKWAIELRKVNEELTFQNEEKEEKAAKLIIAYKELAFQSREKEKRADELIIANKELAYQNKEKEKRAEELIIANKELAYQNEEKEKRAAELIVANKKLAFQNGEKEKRANELIIANKELAFQNREKEKRADELNIANKELAYQNSEKEKRADELFVANKELAFQNDEKEKRAAELIIANRKLAFQNKEKGKRANELIVANKELAFQNREKEKRADELFVANKELAFQNDEKEKRAEELIIANTKLAFQNEEKGKRANELIIANKELAFQNREKEKRADELIIANKELAFQNDEKGKRAAELIIANKELLFQHVEKEKRAAELNLANKELAFQNREKEKRALELIVANEELIKATEKFRIVVESTPNAILLVDDQDFITLVNTQTERLFGYERDELIGHKLDIIVPERFQNQHPKDQNMFFKKGRKLSIIKDCDLFTMRKNGTEVQVEISINHIETDDGHMVLVSINDITERKIQEATQKKQMELEIKNKELEQFAYIASHDLQEPLRTVSNYMQVFEEDYIGLLDDKAHSYLQSVNNATKRMSILIKSLLDYSRLGRNSKLVHVDCKKLINNVLGDLGSLTKSSKAIIEVSKMPKMIVYETELSEVFQNLITNAIKFQKKDSQPKIQIHSEKINDKWTFSVSDNGIGIAPAHFDRVFDIFMRLHSNEENYKGNGIGLANCKKIVQMHKGEIWIESNLGIGTTFHFTITDLTNEK